MGKMAELYCDECNSRIIEETGRYVCPNCGLELGAVYESSNYQLGMVEEPLKRRKTQYAAIDNQLATVSSLGSSIGTIKEYYFKDTYGTALSPLRQEQFRKFKNLYHVASAVKGKETIHRSLTIVNKVCKILDIPEQVNNRAIFLFKKYKREFTEEINNHVVLSAISLLLAVRESKNTCPVQFKEIVETYSELGHRVSGKKIISLMQTLNIKLPSSRIRRSEEYISRVSYLICSYPEIKERVESKYKIESFVYEKILQLACFKILAEIPNKDRGSRRPYPFAAATAYTADKLFAREMNTSSAFTQKLVAKATNVAEFTVREHSELIFKYDHKNIFEEISRNLSSNFS
ncbi:MAG: hypothetical protein ACTSRR_00160 [Candidatus Heimdallarchaeaceae archaeon]